MVVALGQVPNGVAEVGQPASVEARAIGNSRDSQFPEHPEAVGTRAAIEATPPDRFSGSITVSNIAGGQPISQRRRVVNKVVPWISSTSSRSASVKPTLSSTRRDALFQSQTPAHNRSYPEDLAQSMTASDASVAYPCPQTRRSSSNASCGSASPPRPFPVRPQ